MKCPYCNLTVMKTILDNNNNSYCDSCYSPLLGLVTIKNFCKNINYSLEGIELFTKSEVLFNTDNASREDAVRLCNLAAQEGNPDAIINLGYYLERGIIKGNKQECLEKALNCYLSVACYDSKLFSFLKGILKNDLEINHAFNEDDNKEIISTALYNTLCILANNDFSGSFLKNEQQNLVLILIDILKNKYRLKEILELKQSELDLLSKKVYNLENVSIARNDFDECLEKINSKANEFLFAIHHLNTKIFIEKMDHFLESNRRFFEYYQLVIKSGTERIDFTNRNDFNFKKDEILKHDSIIVFIYKPKKVNKKRNYVEIGPLNELINKKLKFQFNPDDFSKFASRLNFLEYLGNYSFNDIIIESIKSIRTHEDYRFGMFIEISE